MTNSIEEKVIKIIREKLCCEDKEIKPETNLIEDLGADSMDIVELQMVFECEFNIEIPDEEFESFKTFGGIIQNLKEKGCK